MKELIMTVEYNRELSQGVFEMKLHGANLPQIKCGQFVNIETGRHDLLLLRPFCIYKKGADFIVIVYAVVGKGTENLSKIKAGADLRAVLPLGNGFTLSEEHKTVVLLGGGIGCAPLLMVPECYPGKKYYSFLGFPDKADVKFSEDFGKVSDTTVCTDNGSLGYKGFPTAALIERLKEIRPDVILTCGPKPMVKAVAKLCYEHGLRGYMSGEDRMGCGVGACLVCACKVRDGEGYKNVRACVEGPVFDLSEVLL